MPVTAGHADLGDLWADLRNARRNRAGARMHMVATARHGYMRADQHDNLPAATAAPATRLGPVPACT
jgi:hypothetical protein